MYLASLVASAARLLTPRLSLTALVLLASLGTSVTSAQNIFAARKPSDISTFAATSIVAPDYFPGRASGITAGLDFTRHYNRHLAVAFEARANRASSDLLIERSILFGPRIQTNLGSRYHPYADYLVGGGTIVFLNGSTNYHEDRSMVSSMGGGVDIDMPSHFAVRLDFQSQSWNIGKVNPTQPDVTFAPTLLTVGVQYHIPFSPHTSRNY